MKAVVAVGCLALFAMNYGCQSSNAFIQNGGLPMRVPAPPTGAVKPSGQYSQISSTTSTSAMAANAAAPASMSPAVASFPQLPTSNTPNNNFSTSVQPASWQTVPSP